MSNTGDFMLVRTAAVEGLSTRLDKVIDLLTRLADATVKPQEEIVTPVQPIMEETPTKVKATRERIRSAFTSKAVSPRPAPQTQLYKSHFKAVKAPKSRETPKQVFHQLSESYSAAPSEEEDDHLPIDDRPADKHDEDDSFVVRKV